MIIFNDCFLSLNVIKDTNVTSSNVDSDYVSDDLKSISNKMNSNHVQEISDIIPVSNTVFGMTILRPISNSIFKLATTLFSSSQSQSIVDSDVHLIGNNTAIETKVMEVTRDSVGEDVVLINTNTGIESSAIKLALPTMAPASSQSHTIVDADVQLIGNNTAIETKVMEVTRDFVDEEVVLMNTNTGIESSAIKLAVPTMTPIEHTFRNGAFTNAMDYHYSVYFSPELIPLFKPFILQNINNAVVESNEYQLSSHPYMHLQRQDQNCCWHHALSGILGFSIHPFIRRGAWLAGALVSFATVNEKELDKFDFPTDAVNIGVTKILDASPFYGFVNAIPQKIDFENEEHKAVSSKILAYKCALVANHEYEDAEMSKVIHFLLFL